jgi:uncharacterized protein with FMN-binding domain
VTTEEGDGMRRITLWILSTVSALILLFSYRTSTMGASGGAGGTPIAAGGTAADTADSSTADSSTADSGGGTYDGSVAQTRWGPVQVRITVAGGRLTNVDVLQVPDGNVRDQQINAYAVPILVQEAVAAQSAQIDTVSGATITSDGYRTSLQAAIDEAHLG